MCRKCLILTYDEVLDVIQEIEVSAPLSFGSDWPARFPIAYPRLPVPLIIPFFDTASYQNTIEPGMLRAQELTWGFVGSWRKSDVIFNTRIESADKPLWQESMKHRRCLIPTVNFYETCHSETCLSPKTGKPIKQQYKVKVPGQEIILIGGIWEKDTFSMVTTQANADMMPIHHRMPLIVRPDEICTWLGPDYQSLSDRSSIPLLMKKE